MREVAELKMSEKAVNVQRKILKMFQKACKTVAQESGSLKAKNKEIRGGSRLMHTV